MYKQRLKHLAALHDIYAQILGPAGHHRKERVGEKFVCADKHLHQQLRAQAAAVRAKLAFG